MAIKISGNTVINDSRGLENITNLKTVNNESILGTGDITIPELTANQATDSANTDYGTVNGDLLGQAVAALNTRWREVGEFSMSGQASHLFSIPVTVTEICVLFNEISLTGTDNILVRIGDSGGDAVSGYSSESGDRGGSVSESTGYVFRFANITHFVKCRMNIMRMGVGDHTWIEDHTGVRGGLPTSGGGVVTLSGELVQVRVMLTGANTYDAGTVNVWYR